MPGCTGATDLKRKQQKAANVDQLRCIKPLDEHTIPTAKAKRRSPLRVALTKRACPVLALLLGMVMMAGVSGLLRQLMSQRLSAKELSTNG